VIEGHVGNAAGALSFTTVLAIVPLTAVMLSVLSLAPGFSTWMTLIQDFIYSNFVPAAGEVVQKYLTQLASKAGRLTAVGLLFLAVTAIMLLATIEQALNDIWRVANSRKLLHRFLTTMSDEPAILVGNSMGGLISILQASAHPETVAGLVLIDPALPVGLGSRPDPLVAVMFGLYAVPAVGRSVVSRRRSARSAEQQALAVMRLCCADSSRVPQHVIEHHLDLARERWDYPDVDTELLMAARSLMWVLARRRLHAEKLRSIAVPVLLLHGDQDRLIPIGSARATAAANPTWRFEVAEGVGHVPQLEVPDWTLDKILDWLETDGLAAAYAASPESRHI